MTIPKVIYQTWKTKTLHGNCIKIRNNIQQLNPDYEMILYHDNDMDIFIKNNFDEFTYNCYRQLNVGASKADFWRYCILYINGGVYLDMDANILRPLDELITDDEQCIITREGNPGIFNNWIMIFEKGHPILLECINKCCYNITNKTTNDIVYLTGPYGPFSNSINELLIPLYNKKVTNLYFETDNNLNDSFNVKTNTFGCRFYSVDMGAFAKFKHEYTKDLYQNNMYWREEQTIFKPII